MYINFLITQSNIKSISRMSFNLSFFLIRYYELENYLLYVNFIMNIYDDYIELKWAKNDEYYLTITLNNNNKIKYIFDNDNVVQNEIKEFVFINTEIPKEIIDILDKYFAVGELNKKYKKTYNSFCYCSSCKAYPCMESCETVVICPDYR